MCVSNIALASCTLFLVPIIRSPSPFASSLAKRRPETSVKRWIVLPRRPRIQLRILGSTGISSSTYSTSALAFSMLSVLLPKIRTVLVATSPSPVEGRTEMLTSCFSCNARTASPFVPMILGTVLASTSNSTECLKPTPSMRLRLFSSALSCLSMVPWKLWICPWCLMWSCSSILARWIVLELPMSFRSFFIVWMWTRPDCSSMWAKQPTASSVPTHDSRPLGILNSSIDKSAAVRPPPAGVFGRNMSFSTMAGLFSSQVPAAVRRAMK
mmetsp:Transcript_55829/g.173063  ORF Transcript_55829/g.173063 Transcript_55829/m.173063 type:complete len:269 (+) Transcript_55829:308-1114(+)